MTAAQHRDSRTKTYAHHEIYNQLRQWDHEHSEGDETWEECSTKAVHVTSPSPSALGLFE